MMRTLSAQYDNSTSNWPGSLATIDSPRTLLLVFGGTKYVEEHLQAWDALRALAPQSTIVGCSSSGEILDDRIHDNTLTAMAVQFETTSLRHMETRVSGPEESRQAGRILAEGLAGTADLKGVFVLSDGLLVNGSELVAGFSEVLPADIAVTGGLAGDGSRFQKTWVLCGGTPQVGAVAAVGFYGPELEFVHGCKGGWDKFGIERTVTKSAGNVVYELDGRPALALYKEYLGDRASGLPATGLLFPLSIRLPQDSSTQTLVRTILGVDEATQSLRFAGDIPQGSYAQLMKANFDRLIDGAADAASGIAATGDIHSLAIAISCVGRRLVLGERTEEELAATLSMLPTGARQIGFYSYGEISPYTNGRSCELHNQTMTLTVLRERPAGATTTNA